MVCWKSKIVLDVADNELEVENNELEVEDNELEVEGVGVEDGSRIYIFHVCWVG